MYKFLPMPDYELQILAERGFGILNKKLNTKYTQTPAFKAVKIKSRMQTDPLEYFVKALYFMSIVTIIILIIKIY